MKHLCLVCVLAAMAAGPARADQWQELSPGGDLPEARYEHTLVALDGAVYLYGGATTGSAAPAHAVEPERPGALYLNDLHKFDSGLNRWTPVQPPAKPATRAGHAAVAAKGKMLVFFGRDSDGPRSDIWAYDPAANTWAEQPSSGASTPAARSNHSAAVANGKVWVFGGQGATSADRYGDLWAYDPETGAWESKAALESPRVKASMMATDTGLVVFGGMAESYLGDLWRYDFLGNSWSKIEPPGDAPAARTAQATASDGNRMWVMGGFGQAGGEYQDFDDVWEYDAAAQTWTRRTDGPTLTDGAAAALAAPAATDGAEPAAAATEERTFLCFGGTSFFAPHNETWQYSVSVPAETSTTTTTAATTTTTTAGADQPCPAEQVLGPGDGRLDALRMVRDRVLARSAVGRALTGLYYRHAGAVGAALERSPALRAAARRLLGLTAALAGTGRQ